MRIGRYHHRLGATGLVLGILLVALLVTAAPSHASLEETARLEQRLVLLVNEERTAADLPALEVRTDLREVATTWSWSMAAQEELAHNPDFATQIRGWKRVSENVGRTVRDDGPSLDAAADRLHTAFMASPTHRANILSRHATQIGIGAAVSGEHVWVTKNLREPISSGAATGARTAHGATGASTSTGDWMDSTTVLGMAAIRGGGIGSITLVGTLLAGAVLAAARA